MSEDDRKAAEYTFARRELRNQVSSVAWVALFPFLKVVIPLLIELGKLLLAKRVVDEEGPLAGHTVAAQTLARADHGQRSRLVAFQSGQR